MGVCFYLKVEINQSKGQPNFPNRRIYDNKLKKNKVRKKIYYGSNMNNVNIIG